MCEGSPAVACSLNQSDLAVRAERWLALADRAAGQVSRTKTGLRLTFRADQGVANELAELAVLERECCGFASWSVHEAGDNVVMDVSAEGDVAIGAVQSLFDALAARG